MSSPSNTESSESSRTDAAPWDERLAFQKTEVDLTTTQVQQALERAARAGASPTPSTDPQALVEALSQREHQCAELDQAVRDLKIQVDALRNDYSALEAEHEAELKAYRAVLDQRTGSREELEDRLKEVLDDNRQLKAQNLNLQYHLSQWGLPVESGSGAAGDSQPTHDKAFFPPMVSLEGHEDPIPVVFKGDLKCICFPDLVSFLANSNLVGVLTVVSDRIVSKLYLDRGILCLAALNDADPTSSLIALIDGADVLPERAQNLKHLPLFDLEIAAILRREEFLSEEKLRQALREHARFILSQVFQLDRGAFFFQPGRIEAHPGFHFRLPLMDVLLHTAAEVDERQRVEQT